MAGNVYLAGPESLAVNGQLLPVAPYYSVMPGPAIGPLLGANTAAVPLATLPSGVSNTTQAGGSALGAAMSSRAVAVALAVSFVAGVLILQFVHWR